jgi:hypothetical protein
MVFILAKFIFTKLGNILLKDDDLMLLYNSFTKTEFYLSIHIKHGLKILQQRDLLSFQCSCKRRQGVFKRLKVSRSIMKLAMLHMVCSWATWPVSLSRQGTKSPPSPKDNCPIIMKMEWLGASKYSNTIFCYDLINSMSLQHKLFTMIAGPIFCNLRGIIYIVSSYKIISCQN